MPDSTVTKKEKKLPQQKAGAAARNVVKAKSRGKLDRVPGVHFTSVSGKIIRPLETYYGKVKDTPDSKKMRAIKKALHEACEEIKMEAAMKQEEGPSCSQPHAEVKPECGKPSKVRVRSVGL